MFKRHSRAGGNPVFERLSGYPIKSGMTDYAFRRTVVQIDHITLQPEFHCCEHDSTHCC